MKLPDRKPITHFLKTESEYYQEVKQDNKRFELRKDDRDFKVNDLIVLKETINGEYTGEKLLPRKIRYILRDAEKFGLKKGYCIIQLDHYLIP